MTSNSRQAATSRRSFFWKLGAGISTAAASAAGVAKPAPPGADDLALRLALMEDENALRELHDAYQHAMDRGMFEAALDPFAADAEVTFTAAFTTSAARV